MHSRVALPLQPNIIPRQRDERPTNRSPPVTHWFYIVDIEATAPDGTHTLRNEGVVLALSAAEADAKTAAALDGLGVVYYAELSETERRRMIERINGPQRNGG